MRDVTVRADSVSLPGTLDLPEQARAVVLFAHGSGSSRHSPRNRHVADRLRETGLGTLLMDLLTPEEDRDPQARFDITLLAERLTGATHWLGGEEATERLPIGHFGASTGAAAALVAAAELPGEVRAVVSRGGRPDLAGDALARVKAPTLLIVGSLDREVLGMNRQALDRLGGKGSLEVVEGATHLFEEPGALDQVADLAGDWFLQHL